MYDSKSTFSSSVRPSRRPPKGPSAGAREGNRKSHRRGSHGNLDGEASDADAIGIYPVQPRWTVLDGGRQAEGAGVDRSRSPAPADPRPARRSARRSAG